MEGEDKEYGEGWMEEGKWGLGCHTLFSLVAEGEKSGLGQS